MNNQGTVGKIFIIDLKKQSYATLPDTNPNYEAACVYKDNLVYIFGGHDGKNYHANCQAFHKVTRKFMNKPSLPQASHRNTTGVFENKLYIARYYMNYIYCFDENFYH